MVGKQLRFLERIYKCFIGTLHELVMDNKMRVEYAPTLTHCGEGFTKTIPPAKFLAAREMMGLVANQ